MTRSMRPGNRSTASKSTRDRRQLDAVRQRRRGRRQAVVHAELCAQRTLFGELRRDLRERRAQPARSRDRKADQGAEGLDRKRGDSIYGTSIAKRQKEFLEKEGATVVGVGAHNFRAIDLTDSVLRAKGAAPDVWINTGYVPDGNLLLRTMRDQGFKPAAILLVGTGDTFETLDALGAEYLEGITVVGYPRPDQTEGYGPGAAAYLAAYKKKYERDPIAPQSMTAYVGVQMLIEAIAAAGSVDMEKVRAAAAKMDKPAKSYATGFGAKFDAQFQNTRAFPTVVQWQSGKIVTVFPKEAAQPNVKLVNLPRK